MGLRTSFWGFAVLETAFRAAFIVRNTSDVPVNADVLPTYRVYGPAGLMANGTGALAFKDTAALTGATNASPIVITSAGHNLQTGMRVTITGVVGNTAANTTATITVIGTNTFSLDGTIGNGVYVSGGIWNVSGLYDFVFTPAAANGFAAGTNYTVLVTATVAATALGEVFAFTVT